MAKKLIVFVSVSMIMIGCIVTAPFVAEYLIVEKALQKADAIVVLSGSAAYAERAGEAAEIYLSGLAPKIFLTDDQKQGGWDTEERRNPFFVQLTRSALIERGVPPEAIEILPAPVAGTHDEATLVVEVAAERGLTAFILVTSAYHSRRALWAFERVAEKNGLPLQIGIAAAGRQERSDSFFSIWTSQDDWNNVAAEFVKIAYYRVVY